MIYLYLKKNFTGWEPNENKCYESLIPLSSQDFGNPDRLRPTRMVQDGVKSGPHSLAAWGYRIGVGKPEHEDWSTLLPLCYTDAEDVKINARILSILEDESKDFGESVQLEHEVQRIISKQERDGVYFDRDRAIEYIKQLGHKVFEIDERLVEDYLDMQEELESRFRNLLRKMDR